MNQVFTPEERQQIAQALRAAKEFLATDLGSSKALGICVAVGSAFKEGKCTDFGRALAVGVVNTRLHPYVFVSQWLFANVPEYQRLHYEGEHKHKWQQIQAYRHRWLDSMIAEFEGAYST